MALDKNRILNDLGHVMNQLQSADCGCMGKLFSNQGPDLPGIGMGAPLPTCGGCRRGCCRGHGPGVNYSQPGYAPCAGEPYSMNNPGVYQAGMGQPGMGQPFMDHSGKFQSGMNRNGLEQAGMRQPGMGQPGMGQPGMGQSGMGQSGMGQPGMGQPGMGHPGMGQPGMGQPGMGHPGMGQPGMGQPGMGQPGIGQPGMGQPGMGQPGMGQPGMGQSAMRMGAYAPKLYADTYNYLSKNVMNPIVQDVYEDLKSITPENTMTNSPLGTQMGLKPGMGGAATGGGSGMPPMVQGGLNMAGMAQQGNMNQMGGNQPQTGGMGAQIAQMMMSDSKPKRLGNPIPLDGSHGQQQGSAPSGHMTNPGQGTPGSMDMGRGNPAGIGMSQGNPGPMGMAQGNPESHMGKNMGQGNPGSQMQDPNANSAMQQMSMGNRDYGEHTQGMKKFNEMFPGVTGVGGDLGFDPMAIAYQMNPANQKQAAMSTMNQMLMGDRKKWIDAANKHLQPSFGQLNQNQSMSQQQQLPGQVQNNAPGQQQMQQQGTPVSQQQVYSATGAPTMNQQSIDPNTPSNPQQGDRTNAQILYQHPAQDQPGQAMYKEHLLPVDTSRNMAPPSRPQKQYQYNTLGQPIEKMPADIYKTVPETGPTTLSPMPYPVKPRQIPANVRNTESKTSILGERTTGRHPRTQLQQIYQQYKGPQTYQQPPPSNQEDLSTSQGISAPTIQRNLSPTRQGVSLSDGQLHQTHQQRNPIQPPRSYPEPSRSPARQIHFEQVGGDTLANNNSVAEPVQVLETIGDAEVPVEKPGDNTAPSEQPKIPVRKSRNGLQDKVYTSSPVTTAWTFHGNNGGFRQVARRPHLYRSNRPVQW